MKSENITNLIAKKVFLQTDGSYLGYVLSPCFDENFCKLVGFCVDDEDEGDKFLPYEDIKLIGQDCIFVTKSLQTFAFDQNANPLGKQIFDNKGCSLGFVRDVIIFGRQVKTIITENCEIPAKFVHFIGKNCIILNVKPQKNIFLELRASLSSDQPKVKVQSPSINSARIGSSAVLSSQVANPARVTLNPISLLNKYATEDIFGLNNELIIKKGQQINQAKIDKAKKHGKLNLLIINSK